MAWDANADQQLDALVQIAPGVGRTARDGSIETLLTDGYAHVLELEAERKKLLEALKANEAEEIMRCVVSLRDRLDEVNRRFGRSRKHDLDRRSPSRYGLDDERPA